MASCTGATTTVTVTSPGTTVTGPPFTATVTVQPPGATTVVVTPTFTVPPPDIPHVYLIDEPGNPYIAGLIGESGGAICFECHLVSDNPVLVPR